MLPTSTAWSATVTWKDPVNGNWSDGTKWSSGLPPAAGDDVVIDADGSYTVTLNTLALFGSLTLGRVDGASAQTLDVTVNGTLLPNNASVVRNRGILLLSGGMLSGAASLTVDGTLSWTRGTITGSGALTVNGTLTIAVPGGCCGISATLDGRMLTNNGNATWSRGNQFALRNNAVLANAGTLQILSDAAIERPDTTEPMVVNSGTLRKSVGSGTATIETHFVNTGNIEPISGTLSLTRFSTLGGTVAGTTTLLLPSGTHEFDGLTLAGTGTTRIDGATVSTVGNGATVAAGSTLHLMVGMLGGDGPLTVNGTLRWDRGTITGVGALAVNGTLNIAVPGGCCGINAILDGRTLTNSGLATFTASNQFALRNNAILANAGTFQFMADSAIQRGDLSEPQILNTGTLRKISGSGTATVEVSFSTSGQVLAESGTLSFNRGFVQSAGDTVLKGGGVASTGTLDFQGGKLSGSGLLNSHVAIGAETSPGLSSGSLSVAKNYTQTSSSVMRVELGGLTAGTGYDQVQLTGNSVAAAMNGGLIVELLPGFVPTLGNEFVILTAPNGSVTGSFTSTQFPSVPGVEFEIVVSAKAVTLKAVAVAPTPTATATATPTSTPTRTTTDTATPTRTFTTTSTATPTRTSTTTSTSTSTPTATFSATSTETRTATVPPTATQTATPTATHTAAATTTPTSTPTPTATLTPTSTSSPTSTPSETATVSPTFTPTQTMVDTPTPTEINTPTLTATAMSSATDTSTPTVTATDTTTVTPTFTSTQTATPTRTSTATHSVTPSPTATVTPTQTPTSTASPSAGPDDLPVSGICLQPNEKGLAGCRDGTPVLAYRCNNTSCTAESLDFLGATATNGDGRFDVILDGRESRGARLLFEAEVDDPSLAMNTGTGGGTSTTPYRTLDFGPISMGTRLDGVRLGPASEAAVRLLEQAGPASFADQGIRDVLFAVDDATSDETFAGEDPSGAVQTALDLALAHPPVDEAVRATRPFCIGDCNDDRQVRLEEILLLVNIAMQNTSIARCIAGNSTAEAAISVDELIRVIDSALTACPSSSVSVRRRPYVDE
jgi:hypothetical protein